jgi:exonuclease-1
MLRHFGITPILVFDGDRLPAKAHEEAARRERREERAAAGRAALAAGNKRAAEVAFQACIDVTPAMAREVQDGLSAEGFTFVVAPYEADAQMALMARTGAVQLVATEDSDLAALGCACILFKLDAAGHAEELCMADVFAGRISDDAADADAALPSRADDDADEDDAGEIMTARRQRRAPLGFRNWSSEQFLCMCILAGCDFLPSLPGIGIVRAHALAKRAGSAARVLSLLRSDTALAAPAAYIEGFTRALHTFKHARGTRVLTRTADVTM